MLPSNQAADLYESYIHTQQLCKNYLAPPLIPDTPDTRLAPCTKTQQHCLARALPGSQSNSRGERTNLAGSRDNEQRRAEIGGARTN